MAKRKKKAKAEDLPVLEASDVATEDIASEPITEAAFSMSDASSEDIASEPIDEAVVSDQPAEAVEDVDVEAVPSAPDDSLRPDEPLPERKGLTVTAIAQFREGPDESWRETTHIKTISKNGAGLVLTREVPVGRIVSLVLDMPQELRLYDHDIPGYLMLAVVQNCVSMHVDDEPFYHVGVAFIGKEIPEAYDNDPRQCYRISGINSDGLWAVVESVNPFQLRKHLRFWSRFEVLVSIRDPKTRTSRKRNVFTRDVSGGGMSVFGPLDAKVGDRVKVMSPAHDFYSMATVRNRTDNDENEKLSLIHFEFDEAEFPVERLATPADGREDVSTADAWTEDDGEVTQF